MNGIGWTEILVVAAFALIVVGPKDLPDMLRKIGKMVGKAKRMTTEFRREFNKVLYDDDITNLKKTFVDPLKQVRGSIDEDIKKINASVMDKAPKGDEMEPIADSLKKAVGKKTPVKKAAPKKAAAKSTTAKKPVAKKTATKAVAKKPAAKKPAVSKTTKAAPVKAAPAKKAPAKKPAAKKAPVKKTPVKKAAAPREAATKEA